MSECFGHTNTNTTLNQFWSAVPLRKSTVMGNLEGAPAVHFNLSLLSFYLYTTFKIGIAAAGEPIPSE